MTVTIRDVARHAGVGVGTVSRVLNNSQAVKSTTRERVLAAIEDLEYVPNEHARRLSTGKTFTIGVIAPFFTSQSVVERLRGIEAVIDGTAYDLVMYNINSLDQLNKYTRELTRNKSVDGLLIISMKSDLFDTSRIKEMNLPTVIVDAESDTFSTITIDDVRGGYLATKHLIDMGHRHIAFLSDIFDAELGNNSSEDRLAGYKTALCESNIPYSEELTYHYNYTREAGFKMSRDLFQSNKAVTAIFATSDMLAAGVIQACKEFDLSIPQDISLIGFDDIELAEFMNLTTVHQPLFESGKRGANELLNQLVSNSGPQSICEITLPIELVIRGTTNSVAR
ncbi:MAG: LacI family DNA-binding transcriptional regulator [Chloroflexota bacterium]